MLTNIPEDVLILLLKSNLTTEDRLYIENWLAKHSEYRMEIADLRRLVDDIKCAYLKLEVKVDDAWKCVDKNTTKQRNYTLKFVLVCRKIVAVVLPVCIIVALFYLFAAKKIDSQLKYTDVEINPGGRCAELWLANGEKINLSDVKQNRIFDKRGKLIGIDSSNTFVYQSALNETPQWNLLRIPAGGEYCLQLVDGTRVWLNSETELRFPSVWESRNRIVELSGEAYFEVAKDSAHPFVVKTKNMAVKVLGTEFNISCYDNDMIEQATLVEGSIEIFAENDNLKLQPGNQLSYDAHLQKVEIKSVDTNLYTSWKEGMFRFCNMKLEELVKKLQRWYNIDFIFLDDQCKSFRFTGAIRKYADFKEFMGLIEETTNVNFVINERSVIIDKKSKTIY